MTIHPQVQASRATVDAGLAELLELLWAAGLTTEFSCQGGDRRRRRGGRTRAMIMFGNQDDALRFMRETMDRSHIYNRMGFRLAEPRDNPDTGRFGPIRGVVRWHRKFTPALVDIWADQPPADILYDRRQHPSHRLGFD